MKFTLPAREGEPRAEFFSQYGHDLDTSSVKACWAMSGPQNREDLPNGIAEVFNDPAVVEVIVKRQTETGVGGQVVQRYKAGTDDAD